MSFEWDSLLDPILLRSADWFIPTNIELPRDAAHIVDHVHIGDFLLGA